MHLRHYTLRTPSGSKRATYAEARKRYGMHGVLPEQLPDEYSWVEPYFWGGDDEPDSIGEDGPADGVPGETSQADAGPM